MRRKVDRVEDVANGLIRYIKLMLIFSAAVTMYGLGKWDPIVEWLTNFAIYVGVGIVMGLVVATYYKLRKKRMSRLDIMENF